MKFALIVVLSCGLATGQTKENLVTPASSAPAATLTKSGDIGGGLYVISAFDPGRRLLKAGTVPVIRDANRYNIALYKLAPLASLANTALVTAASSPPTATLTKSGDIGGGLYVILTFDPGRRLAKTGTIVFDPGRYLFANVVWYASGAGPPLTPPARDGINNPLVFR